MQVLSSSPKSTPLQVYCLLNCGRRNFSWWTTDSNTLSTSIVSAIVHVLRLRRLHHTVSYCTSHTEFNQPKTRLKHQPWPRRRRTVVFTMQSIDNDQWINLQSTTNKCQNTCCESDFSNFWCFFWSLLNCSSGAVSKFDAFELLLNYYSLTNDFQTAVDKARGQ